MRAELFRPDAPDEVVAEIAWNDGAPEVVSGVDVAGVSGLLRPTAVQIDDAALRRMGTSGPSLLAPGSLEWFRAAIRSRAETLGLGVRFVTHSVEDGWDPASQYRRFRDQAQRLAGATD